MKIIFAAFILIICISFLQPEQTGRTKGTKVKDGWSESYGDSSRPLASNC